MWWLVSVVVRPCVTQTHHPKGEEFGNSHDLPSSLLGSEGSEETLSHGGAEGLAASLEQELLELVLCLCIHSDLQADAKTEQLSSCQSAPTARSRSFNSPHTTVASCILSFNYYLFTDFFCVFYFIRTSSISHSLSLSLLCSHTRTHTHTDTLLENSEERSPSPPHLSFLGVLYSCSLSNSNFCRLLKSLHCECRLSPPPMIPTWLRSLVTAMLLRPYLFVYCLFFQTMSTFRVWVRL